MAKQKKPSFYRDLGVCLAFVLAHIYLGFTALQGTNGLFARIQVNDQIAELEAKLAETNAKIAVMENKTKRLSNEFLDLELLDEVSRKRLGYVHLKDRVIN